MRLALDEKPSDVLTIEDLAAYLKIPKSTLYKLVREGKIPPRRSAGTDVSGKGPLTTGLRKRELSSTVQEEIHADLKKIEKDIADMLADLSAPQSEAARQAEVTE